MRRVRHSDLSFVLVEWRVFVPIGRLIRRHIVQLIASVRKAFRLFLGGYMNLGLEIVIVFIHGGMSKRACHMPISTHAISAAQAIKRWASSGRSTEVIAMCRSAFMRVNSLLCRDAQVRHCRFNIDIDAVAKTPVFAFFGSICVAWGLPPPFLSPRHHGCYNIDQSPPKTGRCRD
jgi:hypothetical protein